MPNLTRIDAHLLLSLAATARSTSVVVGLLSMSVSVIMAESSSLAWTSESSTPSTPASLVTMVQLEPQGRQM